VHRHCQRICTSNRTYLYLCCVERFCKALLQGTTSCAPQARGVPLCCGLGGSPWLHNHTCLQAACGHACVVSSACMTLLPGTMSDAGRSSCLAVLWDGLGGSSTGQRVAC
jgi:hypothetical protein